MGRTYINKSKTSKTPRRPFEKERIDNELQIIGQYGLRNKKEVWRVQLVLAKLRKAARELLTLEAKDPKRIFEGSALMRRMFRYGLLNEDENKLDYILALNVNKLMERRLQTVVYRSSLAQSIHQARVLIRHKHIKVGKNLVDSPSFMVRVESEKAIDRINQNKVGRTKRKKQGNKKEE